MLQNILDHPTPAVAALPEEKKKILQEGGAIAMPYSNHMKIGTPSGKFRIIDESLPEPIPHYFKINADNYPLHLVASPSVYSLNSEFRDRKDLMDARGSQKLIMHTADAAARGIKTGQLIKAFNDRAEVVFEALVTDQIGKGNVVCEGVYRRDQCVGGRAMNALTSERLADMADGTTMNDNRVEVCVL